ncbi:MAG: hypothetical protein IPI60_00140 [Saprospiraceae bacterium]|nr:hypothetical protein [Saprospiraceae bacterium]
MRCSCGYLRVEEDIVGHSGRKWSKRIRFRASGITNTYPTGGIAADRSQFVKIITKTTTCCSDYKGGILSFGVKV